MPKHKRAATSSLPSREDILAFIKEAKGKVGKREIARAFGLNASQKIGLKHLLKDMENDGAIDRRRKSVGPKGALPTVTLADIVGRDRDGELLATPVEWDETDNGPAPKILVHVPRKPRPGTPVPGVGDRALIRVEPSHEEGPAYLGRVVKILPKRKAETLGIFRAATEGGGRLLPISKKELGRELIIPPGQEGEAQDGDLVSVSVGREGRYGPPKARVKERLGSIKSEKTVSLIAIHAHGIPNVFSPATLKEAEAAEPATKAGREDWRKLPLVTIDPADAKDHDDAVHAAPDDDPKNEGGFVLTVAIADVAAYVRPGSALDREAVERGNSVYFPDRVVPMLPERISNDLCSLRPNEDRPSLAARIVIDRNGHKKHHSFHRVLMRSAAKLSYQQAQAAIDGQPDDTTKPLLDGVLRPLWAAYAALARARDERGPLALDLPERKLILNEDGTLARVIVPERLEAHRLIEEFMILANVCAAETLEEHGSLLLYRAHDEPSLEKMEALREVLASVGFKLAKDGALRPAMFNRILAMVAESEHGPFVNEVILRTQAQAEYSAENYGHFGLNLRRYAHFTSPIRRYADLIVHRALITALKLGPDGLPKSTTREALAETAANISAAERRAMAAERETVDRLIAHHLADRIGATFEGRISGVTRSGLFVKLDDTGADGFVPASTLGADYYRFEEAQHALVGSRSGEMFRLGDRVSVELVEAAPVAGALRFAILSEGQRRSGARKTALRKGAGRATSGDRTRGDQPRKGKEKPRWSSQRKATSRKKPPGKKR